MTVCAECGRLFSSNGLVVCNHCYNIINEEIKQKEGRVTMSEENKYNPFQDVQATTQINPKIVNGELKGMYDLAAKEPKKLTLPTVGLICVFVALLVFFVTRNYRNEELINQAKSIAQQTVVIQQLQNTLQQTANVIAQVNWPKDYANVLKKIGYENVPVAGEPQVPAKQLPKQ